MLLRKISAIVALLVASLLAVSAPASAAGGALCKKLPHGAKSCIATRQARLTGPYFFYAEAHQNPAVPVSTTSVAAQIDVATPGQVPSGDHSLLEIAVSDGAGNTIEVGWNVDPGLYGGSTNPHVFTSAWVGGVWKGYNGSGGGWTDYAPNPVNAGADISSWVGGAAKVFAIQYDSATDAWWLTANNAFIGSYSRTALGWPTSFKTVSSIQVFSEVASSTTTPCDDAGTGVLPVTGAARIGSVTYDVASGGSTNVKLIQGAVTNASWYNEAPLSATTTRSVAVGGPGSC